MLGFKPAALAFSPVLKHKERRRKRYCSNISSIFIAIFTFAVILPRTQAQYNGVVGGGIGNVGDLVIHLVPHTHVEHAWTDTMENYKRDTVDHIITQVVNQLSIDSQRRFVWAELAYFRDWYDAQTLATKARVQEVVSNGQLEFVGGGFVEHEEALSTFESVASDIGLAHEWLHTNLGTRPRVAWQIDNAGHSQVTPAMYAQMGYDALVLGTVHSQVLQQFKTSQHLEFIWEGVELGGATGGGKNNIFTHVMLDGFKAPEQCDFESPGVRQVVTPSRRSKYLVQFLQERARYYKTQHLLVPLGDRFRFYSAEKQFTNWDKLMRYINEKIPGVRIQYSTASEYFAAIRSTASLAGLKYPTFSDSLYPYATADDSYWVGAYSSRPTLKASIRSLQSLVRSANTLFTLARARADAIGDAPHVTHVEDGHVQAENEVSFRGTNLLYGDLAMARTASALSSSHHTLMGMLRSDVADDVENKVQQGMRYALNTITGAVESLLTMRKAEFKVGGPRVRPELDVSTKHITLGEDNQQPGNEHLHHPIVLFNTQLTIRAEVVKIQIEGLWRHARHLRVIDGEGNPVAAQVQNEIETTKVGFGSESDTGPFAVAYKTVLYLYFVAEIPPLGVATYFVHTTSARDRVQKGSVSSTASTPMTQVYHIQDGSVVVPEGMTAGSPKPKGASSFRGSQQSGTDSSVEDNGITINDKLPMSDTTEGPTIENNLFLLEFHATTGLLKAVTDKRSKRRTLLNQDLRVYTSTRSGAVLFRPDHVAETKSLGSSVVISIVRGPLVQLVSVLGNGFHQTVRIMSVAPDSGSQPSAARTAVRGAARGGDEARAGVASNLDPTSVAMIEGEIHLVQHISADSGTDVVMHYDTSMHSDGKLLVDNSVGQLTERAPHRDANLASSFFPAATTVGLRDLEPTAVSRMGQMLVIVSQTPHAVASPVGIGGGRSTGSIQMILHRSHPNDDGTGLSEGLEDSSTAEIRSVISLDLPDDMLARLPGVRHRHLNPIVPLFAKEKPSTAQLLGRKNWVSRFIPSVSYLNKNTDFSNLELVSLEPQNAVTDTVVARMRNTAVGNPTASNDVAVDPSSLFSNDFVVTSVRASSLATTQSVEDMRLEQRVGESGSVSNFGIGGSASRVMLDSSSSSRDAAGSSHRSGHVSESLLSTLDLQTGGVWAFEPQDVRTYVVTLVSLTDAQLRRHQKVFENAANSKPVKPATSTTHSGSNTASSTKAQDRGETPKENTRHKADPVKADAASSEYDSLDHEIEELSQKISVEKKKVARYTRNVDHYLEEIESLEEIGEESEDLSTARENLSNSETQLARGREVLEVLEKELIVLKKRRSTPSSTLDGQYQNRPAEYMEREKEATMHGAIAGAGGMLVCVIALQWVFGRRKTQAYVPLGVKTGSNNSPDSSLAKKL